MLGEHVERNWLSIRRSPCNKRSTCWSVLMCCKKTSWVTLKKCLYSTYSSFLVINVCNQWKILCSLCVIQVCWQFPSKLSGNLYDIYHCCVYGEKLLTMGRGTGLKHVEFCSKNKFEKLVHIAGFIIRIFMKVSIIKFGKYPSNASCTDRCRYSDRQTDRQTDVQANMSLSFFMGTCLMNKRRAMYSNC